MKQNDPKEHHLCDECFAERTKNKMEISPNIWCFHEYMKVKKERELYTEVLKKKRQKKD